MNWFTRSHVGHYPHDLKRKEVEQWGGCEHVTKDPSLLHIISYENDSFGREGYCLCEACHKAILAAKDEEHRDCYDCRQVFAFKDLTAWTSYDHYPSQGDTPIYLCVGCQTKPKHLDRVKHDQENYRAEFGDRDDDLYFD
jgi:hypothetical protein